VYQSLYQKVTGLVLLCFYILHVLLHSGRHGARFWLTCGALPRDHLRLSDRNRSLPANTIHGYRDAVHNRLHPSGRPGALTLKSSGPLSRLSLLVRPHLRNHPIDRNDQQFVLDQLLQAVHPPQIYSVTANR